jgi:soluble lytic murein transglycosylase-like protein
MAPFRAVRVLPVTLLILLAAPALGRSADQYLTVRKASHFDRKATLPMLEASPETYRDRAAELRGTVNGSSRGASGVTFMLTMENSRVLFFSAPTADTAVVEDVSSQRVRVLVCGSPEAGTTGMPLKVLAIALDSEVTAREPAPTPQRAEVAQARQSRPIMQSRGLTVRPVQGALAGLTPLASQYLSPAAQAVYPRYRAFIEKWNKRLTPQEADEIAVSILYFAPRHKVDPRLVIAMIIAESDFDPKSTSNKGAMGLGQIMPDEARSFQLTDPYNPIQNVRAAVNMLKMKLQMYREVGMPDGMLTLRQMQLAMAAYNAGSGAVRKYGGIPPYRETQGYVKRVMRMYRELCGGG